MLNCVPVEIAATINFFKQLTLDQFVSWVDFLYKKDVKRVYIHWPTLMEWLSNSTLHNNDFMKEIIDLWEMNFLYPIPLGNMSEHEDKAELPAIVFLNNRIHPDNVRVYCGTFGEYVELRKHFGEEDVKY